ncbi:hypothetical protein [Cellulomonas endometrii]|uniref:hypothetical protein n=1 Tax=Cellulomonas endometrii TaxID=3036301 RepID=UPI0024AD9017|nr:hypothetical protein [Cellulomonas endometrii]
MPDTVHLIVTFDDGCIWAESPQLPGFVMARPTQTEFLRDYKRVLGELGVRQVVGHSQHLYETPEGIEYALRFRDGVGSGERAALANGVQRMLATDARDEFLADSRTDASGVVVIVCARTIDQLGDIFEEIDQRGETIVLAAPWGADMVWTTQLAHGDLADNPGWISLEQYGLSHESTVGQLIAALGDPSAAKNRVLLAV